MAAIPDPACRAASAVPVTPGVEDRGLAPDAAATAIERAAAQLQTLQDPDGSWCGTLEGDAAYTAWFILLTRYLNRPDPALEGEMVRYLRASQADRAGWAAWPAGPPSLDITVLCYAALKACGESADDPVLVQARQVIASLGGIGVIGAEARSILVFCGQIPLAALLPSSLWEWPLPFWIPLRLPPQVEAAHVPLALLCQCRVIRSWPQERGISELTAGVKHWRPPRLPGDGAAGAPWWTEALLGIFETYKRGLAWLDGLCPRRSQIPVAAEWIESRLRAGQLYTGILQSLALALMALESVDAKRYRNKVDEALGLLKTWIVRDERGAWIQFWNSRTWDSALALHALASIAEPKRPDELARAAAWLIRNGPDPATNPIESWNCSPYSGDYPEIDTTTNVLLALAPWRRQNREQYGAALRWLLSMQGRGGGWATWGRNHSPRLAWLCERYTPGMGDLPDVDVTANVLTLLATLRGTEFDERERIERAIGGGIAFLERSRRPDGTWRAHWWVNYLCGTARVLVACNACGVDMRRPDLARAADWLETVQNPDGGWGEDRDSYRAGRFLAGPSDPCTTAYVLEGLLAAARRDRPCVLRAVDYIARAQRDDGLWEDRYWRAVGIPGHRYLKFELHSTCLCLRALTRYMQSTS